MKYLILLLLLPTLSFGQKTHIRYDTVKTVTQVIDYAPDTISVYFEELIIKKDTPRTQWHKGYLVYQRYHKGSEYGTIGFSSNLYSIEISKYYVTEYGDYLRNKEGLFLYDDKTRYKGIILNVIKR